MSHQFLEDDPKYRCCCQCMRVRTGALIIGLVHAIGILMSFMRFTRATVTLYDKAHPKMITEYDKYGDTIQRPYDPHFQDTIPSLLSAILFTVSIFSVISLFWGVFKCRPKFLIPQLVLLITSIVTCGLSVIFFIVALSVDSTALNIYIKEQLQAVGYDNMPETTRLVAKIVAGAGIVFCLACMGLNYWFYIVVRNCYRYLLEKKDHFDHEHTGARYAVGGVEPGTCVERQPIVIIQPPSSGGATGNGHSPPPVYTEKY